MDNHLFCFGFGYVAKSLAKRLSGWKVTGTHTNLNNSAINEYIFNEQVDLDLSLLDDVTHILISIPPTEDGDLVYRCFSKYFKTLKKLSWIGYISSTSVYGDHLGKWVDETSATLPIDNSGKNRLISETQWLSTNLPVNIFRLAAIYGPGRIPPRLTRIKKANHYFSRIHLVDIVEMIKKVMLSPKLGEIFNLTDDFPCPQHEPVSFACDLLNENIPPLIDFNQANLSPNMRSYYLASKKVSNRKIKNIYGIELTYPSYKEGLIALL